MKTKSKFKILLPIVLVMGVLISAFSGIFYYLSGRNSNEVYALDTKIEAPVTVSKVKNSYLPKSESSGTVTLDAIQTSANETIKNNELLILNTNEHVYISFNVGSLKYENGSIVNGTEYTDKDTKYITLNVNAFLNNKQLLTNETITGNNSTDRYYFQFLDLKTLKYKDETDVPASEIEGHYKFVFNYSTKEGNIVTTGQSQTVEFYVFKAETYKTNDTDKIKVEPRLYNTEKIDRSYFSTNTENIDGIEYNYFNYNNENTTGYFANSNKETSTLLFPQLSYDVTKYNIKFRHSLYGVYSDYQVMFNGFDAENGYPILSLIKDGVEYSASVKVKIGLQKNNVSVISSDTLIYSFEANGEKLINDIELVKQNAIANPINDRYIATLTFSNIGEYDYTYNYVIEDKQYNDITNKYTSTYFINSPDSTSKADATFVKNENWKTIGNSKMYLFGYQLFHSDYSNQAQSNDKEFRNGELITDLSYLNQATTTTTNETTTTITNNSFEGKSLSGIDTTKICSTNQAPVTISYYAAMTLDSNKTESYYYYWKSVSAFENGDTPTVVNNITNDTRFTNDGYYQVFIKYNFANYKKINAEKTALEKNSQDTAHYQFFSFAINNSEPIISVINEKGTVASNGYTNQDVTVTWSANTVFDITPRVKVLKHLFEEENPDSWITVYNNNQESVSAYGITYSNTGTESLTIGNSYNGLYQVIINYGPGSNTSVKYRFSIDTADISDLQIYEILNETNQTITYQQASDITSSGFVLDYNEKLSGAQITTTYDFIPLEENGEDFDKTNISLLNNILQSTDKTVESITETLKTLANAKLNINLLNGYSLKTINQNLPYVKAKISEITSDETTCTGSLESLESLKTSAGFYLFSLTDQAGNTAYKVVFVDKSTPTIYKFIEEETSFTTMIGTENIASRNSIVVWGNNKQIKIDSSVYEALSKFLTTANQTDSFNFTTETTETTTGTQTNASLLIKIKKAVFKDNSSTEAKQYTDTREIETSYQDFYIKYANESDGDTLENRNHNWNYGEHIHSITVFDQSLNTIVANDIKNIDNYNKVYNTTQTVTLEMNGDNSLLMAYLTDDNGSYKRVYDSEISNNNKLYLEWLQNTDTDYEVSSITWYYFPLTFEKNSNNYPYSSTPQTTESLNLESVTISSEHNNKVMSASINTQGGAQTVEGMYLIRREYKNPINGTENVSGDYSPRYYLFFIDRNKVISYTSALQLLGEKIGFNIGYYDDENYPNYKITFSGSDFLVDSSTENLKFTTSKLPIGFINSINELNKFDNDNKTITDNNTNYTLNSENTGYNISSTIFNSFKLEAPIIKYKASASGEYSEPTDNDILSFKKNGYYQVTLRDKTSVYNNYDGQANDKNNYVFTFRVDVESPRAQVAKYTQNGNVIETISYDEEEQNISTNKQNMMVIWSKPASEAGFDAEIDTKNFKVVITLEDGKTTTYLVKDGILTINDKSTNATLSVHDISTDELKANSSFENPTWDYYIDFADILNILPSEYLNQSAKFEITLQYVGNEKDYFSLTTETPNKFFYTIKNVVFDFKKPEYNLNRLLLSDAYLNNYYKDQLETTSLFDIFNNLESEINFENYAFTVDKNFTLDYAIVDTTSIWSEKNMDTYKMFIRKYDKYSDNGRESEQSLTPDDTRCNDSIYTATRLKFDENYRLNGNKVYTNISDYYWDNGEHKDYTLEYIINDKFDGAYDCYYEIIEVDYAGNYRVYTIYVKESLEKVNTNAHFGLQEKADASVTEKTLTFENVSRYKVNKNNTQITLIDNSNIETILNSYSFSKLYSSILSLTSLSDKDEQHINQYVTVKVEDINRSLISTLTLSPNGDYEQFISDLNQLYSEHNQQSGNIYYITFITSLGEVLKIEHRKPNQDYPAYTITRGDTGFTISFTVSTNDVKSSSYFTEFNAYMAENGVMDENTPLTVDSNGKTIISNIEEYLTSNNLASATFSYTFKMQGNSGSEYYLIFGDNFDRQLKIREIVGVEDNDDKIVYEASSNHLSTITAYDENDISKTVNLTYTNNLAYVKFQNVLYSVNIYTMELQKTGDRYLLKQLDEIVLDSSLFVKDIDGIWTYPLITEQTENDTIFKVILTSTVGKQVYYVGYHNTINNVYINKPADNQSGNLKIQVKDQDVNTFDREVYISFNNQDSLFPITITGKRTYINSKNETITEDLGAISNNQTLSQLGSYTFTVENNLGTKITFIVKLEEKISNNYWVTHYINGIDNGALVPVSQDRSNQYDYGTINNPIKFFTIYEFEVKTDTANNYTFEHLGQDEIKNGTNVVATKDSYKIYQKLSVDGENTENDVTYITVTKVTVNNNFVRSYDNAILINNVVKTGSSITITQDEENKTKSAILSLNKYYNIVEGNDIIMTVTYNSQFLREVNLSKVTDVYDLTFEDSGIYQFTFRDIAGNTQVFEKNSKYFQMALINDVIFTINGSPAVNNSVFNSSVVLALQNLDKFSGDISVISKLNGKQITIKSVNKTYTYTDYGFYEITLSGVVKKDSQEAQTRITTVFKFRIINTHEAMATFEYIGLNNYEITKVEKLVSETDTNGIDLTDGIKEQLGVSTLSTLALSSLENGLGGAGYYRITVNAKYSANKPEQSFTFDVWLNNDFDILIKASINFGDSTTSPINLTLNKQQIYNKVGECKIYLNNTEWLVINADTAKENLTEVFTIEQTGVYNVRLVSNSGNTLESFMLTKVEPLNAVAIIVIVLSVIVAGVIVFIFIKLRKNMKVK